MKNPPKSPFIILSILVYIGMPVILTITSSGNSEIISIIVIFISSTFFYFSYKKYQKYIRLNLDDLESKTSEDKRNPVLFLRSFNADNIKCYRPATFKGFLPWTKENNNEEISFEEAISYGVIENIGPMIALGSPDDKLRTYGAYKKYSSNNDWKDDVKEFCSISQIILILEGEGSGLEWELLYIRRNVNYKKVYFLTYPSPFPRKDIVWKKFDILLEKCGYITPKHLASKGSLFRVNEEWELICISENIDKMRNYSLFLND